jgi:glycosyltransferase involved in cell wall biosynthesis
MPSSSELKTYVIVPCYNEELRIDTDYWNSLTKSLEFNWVFVNDGSTDQTKSKLEKISNINVLNLEVNSGKAEAIRAGINYAISRNKDDDLVACYIDSDSAFQVVDIKRIFEIFQNKTSSGEIESVWASRVALAGRNITRSTTRHHLARIIITIIGFVDKNIPYDPQTGFKIFYLNSKLKQIFAEKFKTRWFFDIEILRRWEKLTGSRIEIWEEPVNYWYEVGGSKVNKKQYIRIFKELLHILLISVKNK